MKYIKLNKSLIRQLEEANDDECIEFTLAGFPAFLCKNEFGEYETPNGTRFYIGFYNPNTDILKVTF